MFEQMVKDMYVPPDVLAQLSDEQRDVLHYEIRQEQIRRYNEWQNTPDSASATPKTKRRVKLLHHQKRKKEKHVTFGMGNDGKVAVQRIYVEKLPPINGSLAIVRPDGGVTRPVHHYPREQYGMEEYPRHPYDGDYGRQTLVEVSVVPIYPRKQFAEIQTGAVHDEPATNEAHRENRYNTRLISRAHLDTTVEPMHWAPPRDNFRPFTTNQMTGDEFDTPVPVQTNTVSIPLKANQQLIRPNEPPSRESELTSSHPASEGLFSSRRAMSMDIPTSSEISIQPRPNNTIERIVHIRTASNPDISHETPSTSKLPLPPTRIRSRRSMSSVSSDSDSSDFQNIRRSRGFQRLMISENGSVQEVDVRPRAPADTLQRTNTQGSFRIKSDDDTADPHTRPKATVNENTKMVITKSFPRSQPSPSPRFENHLLENHPIIHRPKFESHIVPPTEETSRLRLGENLHSDIDDFTNSNFENIPPTKIKLGPPIHDNPRSNFPIARLSSQVASPAPDSPAFGRLDVSSKNPPFEQPSVVSPSDSESPYLQKSAFTSVKTNGYIRNPSPIQRRRPISKVDSPAVKRPLAPVSRNISEGILRRQEELRKAVNQQEQRKSSSIWFHDSEALRLRKEFHLPQSLPDEGFIEDIFRHVPPWFHGPLSKHAVEQMLRQDGRNGAFLLRVSSTFRGYVISYLWDDLCQHQIVSVITPEETSISDSQRPIPEPTSYQLYSQTNSSHFESLQDLVHFYRTTSLTSAAKQYILYPVGQLKGRGNLPDYAHLFYPQLERKV